MVTTGQLRLGIFSEYNEVVRRLGISIAGCCIRSSLWKVFIEVPFNIEVNSLNPGYAVFKTIIVSIGGNKFGFASIDIIIISKPS